MTVAGFRREVARRRGTRKRGAPRYEDALVSFAVAHARGARAQGGSMLGAARELGVSVMTLSKWMSRDMAGARSCVREVVVSPAAPRSSSVSAGTLTLTTASGHVVSGLDVSQAAALLGALS